MAGEKKDPAFLFFVTAWLQSETVRAMSLEARGAYVELLSFAWLHGSIPADHEKLRGLLGITRARFAKLWPVLQPCWVAAAADASRLVNERQEAERAERREKAEKNRESGRRGGRRTAERSQGSEGQRPGGKRPNKRRSNSMADAQANATANATANASAPPKRTLKPSTSTTRGTPQAPQGEGPAPSGEGDAASRPAAEPPQARRSVDDDGASPVADLTSALMRTRYRAGISNGMARRGAIRAQAERLHAGGRGLTLDDVDALVALAEAKSRDDPGALLAHWLDKNEWRGVLDEQRSKAKESALRARGAPEAGDPGPGPRAAASVLEEARRRSTGA